MFLWSRQQAVIWISDGAVPHYHMALTRLSLGNLHAILKIHNFNHVLMIGILRPSCDNTLRWMPQDLTDDKSTLVLVMTNISPIRQWAITWANVDPDLCCHTASQGHNELKGNSSFHYFLRFVFINGVKWLYNMTFAWQHNCFSFAPGRCSNVPKFVIFKHFVIRSSDNDSTGFWPPGSLHTLGADGHI